MMLDHLREEPFDLNYRHGCESDRLLAAVLDTLQWARAAPSKML